MKTQAVDTARGTAKKSKKNTLLKRIISHRVLYLFLAPTLIYLAIFIYGPMYGIQIAFKNYNPAIGIWESPWIGLQHFIDFVKGYNFKRLLGNTLTLSIYQLILGFPMPILLALLLNEIRNQKYKKFVQTTLYAPHFISMVVLVGIIIIILSPSTGIINKFLVLLGLESKYFMIQPKAFKHIYVLSGIWQNTGWNAIIYLAALSSVDPQLHEAATIDGANRLERIWHINIPSIMPTVTILLIMSVGSIASVGFEKAYLLQNPLNLETSEIISTFVYKRGLIDANYSYSTAVGLFNNVINIIMLLLANFVAGKVSETSLF
jgi:putative aldouronate transport system permease protein